MKGKGFIQKVKYIAWKRFTQRFTVFILVEFTGLLRLAIRNEINESI